MFAIFILAVSILALAGIATSSIASVRVARDQQQASDLASAEVEAARGVDFAALALDAAGAPFEALPATYAGEGPPVAGVGGPISHRETIAQGSQTFEVLRWVTMATNHNVSSDQDPIKRLIIRVSWDDRGMPRQVTDSTIIAAVERGLPVPRFDLSPDDTVVPIPPGSTAPACAQYNVTNLGLTDSYAWRPVNPQDSNAVQVSSTADGIYADTSRKWSMRAWLQVDDGGGRDLEAANKMWDSRPESSGRPWMESTARVDSRETAWFTVCFTSTDTTAGATISNEQTYSIRVRSQFDESVIEIGTVSLRITQPRLDLYLHERTDNHTGNWSGGDHKRVRGSTAYPVMFMDTQPALDELVHDMDSDYDTFGLPGIRLNPSISASFGRWDYSVVQDQSLRTVSVTIHARTGTADPAQLTFTLQRVSSTGAPLETYAVTPDATAVTTVPSTFGSVTWSGTFDLVGGVAPTFPSGDVLRLTVGCVSSATACHVDFDTASRQGTLQVRP